MFNIKENILQFYFEIGHNDFSETSFMATAWTNRGGQGGRKHENTCV